MANKNTFGAQILFAEAKGRLDHILQMVDEFNGIAETLVEMGYTSLRDDNIWSHGEPFPMIDVSANNTKVVWDSAILDSFFEDGPASRMPQPIRRASMGGERLRLGRETGWKCFYCGGSGDDRHGPDGRVWHVDHAYPVIRGGDDQPDNHVLACATCNLQKKTQSAHEYFARKLRAS